MRAQSVTQSTTKDLSSGVRADLPEGWVRPEPWSRPWRAWAAGTLVVAALAAGLVRLVGADDTSGDAGTKRLVARPVDAEPNPLDAIEESAPADESPATTTTTAVHTYVSEGNAEASGRPFVTTTTLPPTEVPVGATGTFGQWDWRGDCDRAVAQVNHPLPPGWSVHCQLDEASYVGGEPVIHLNPGQIPAAETYAHELGHAYDVAELTDDEQDEWARARGYTTGFTTGEGGPCLNVDGCIPPSEDFADAFACALGWCRMVYGGPVPSAEQVALLWSLIG